MIEAWQVWLADLEPVEGHEQGGVRPVVVVSSEFALRVNVGRMVTVAPITSKFRRLDFRIQITNPKGEPNWVITEQLRTISTARFARMKPWWNLSEDEINDARRALRFMVDF